MVLNLIFIKIYFLQKKSNIYIKKLCLKVHTEIKGSGKHLNSITDTKNKNIRLCWYTYEKLYFIS